jgi:hypothetical protein
MILIMMIDLGNHRAMRPRLNRFLEKRLVTNGEVKSLSIIKEFLEFEVRGKLSILFGIRQREEIFGNIESP